jgi:hypothetical protein
MPKINEVVAALTERVNALAKELEAVVRAHSETSQAVTDLRREHEKEIALFKREIEDFKKWKDEQKKEGDERNRRLWAFGPSIVGAIVSGLVAFVVAYFTAHR